jgi:L-glyceraldehyde 3-phosphate reductase
MWPGPYGQGGGGRKYVLASLDQSLRRMGLDYVDIFYSHRPGRHDAARGDDGRAEHRGQGRQGALRRHLVLLGGRHGEGGRDPRRSGHAAADPPALVLDAQPLDRDRRLLDTLEQVGAGCIGFSPLAQGMLTDKYLDGVPEGSRASQDKSLSTDLLTEEALDHVRALNDIAAQRGQSLAQMALAWALRDPRVTTVLVGASSDRQLEQNVGALQRLDFGDDELAAIDEHAVDTGIDLWAQARAGEA